jgi:hypothetical protein
MKSLTSILKAALESKQAAQPEKKKRGRKSKSATATPAKTPDIVKPKTRRSTRGG